MNYDVKLTKHGKKITEKTITKEMKREGTVKEKFREIAEDPFPKKENNAKKLKNTPTADYRWDFSYKGVAYRIGYCIDKEKKDIYIVGTKTREDLAGSYRF